MALFTRFNYLVCLLVCSNQEIKRAVQFNVDVSLYFRSFVGELILDYEYNEEIWCIYNWESTIHNFRVEYTYVVHSFDKSCSHLLFNTISDGTQELLEEK